MIGRPLSRSRESCSSYRSRWSSCDFSIVSRPPSSIASSLIRSMAAAATLRRLIFSSRVRASVLGQGSRTRSATSNSSGVSAMPRSSSSHRDRSTRRGRAISVMPWKMWFRTSKDRHSYVRREQQHQPTPPRSRRTTTFHAWESTSRAAVRANDRCGETRHGHRLRAETSGTRAPLWSVSSCIDPHADGYVGRDRHAEPVAATKRFSKGTVTSIRLKPSKSYSTRGLRFSAPRTPVRAVLS